MLSKAVALGLPGRVADDAAAPTVFEGEVMGAAHVEGDHFTVHVAAEVDSDRNAVREAEVAPGASTKAIKWLLELQFKKATRTLPPGALTSAHFYSNLFLDSKGNNRVNAVFWVRINCILGNILLQGQGMACYRRHPLDRIQPYHSVPF